jgi:hypothetical protein
LRARTESFEFRLVLGDRDDDLLRELGEPPPAHWRELGMPLNRPGTDFLLDGITPEAGRRARAARLADDRAPRQFNPVAFSPDGRRLVEGEDFGVRLWGERSGKAYFFDGAEVNGSLGKSRSLWEVAEGKKKLADLHSFAAFDVYGGDAPVNSPEPVAGGGMPLTERGPAMPSLLYQPVAFNEDPRLFTNLLAYAPGLDTSDADLAAVVEAEAAPQLRAAPGHIDPAARRLIERAHQGGWQALALAPDKGHAGPTLVFDGQGRYAWERTLLMGLREQVVCDGTTLLHLYP